MTKFAPRIRHAFTLMELLVVIVIIAILIGLFFGITSSVMSSARNSRAAGEVASLELALTRFQIDNGFYPTATNITIVSAVTPNIYMTDPSSTNYQMSGRELFFALTGRTMYNFSTNAGTNRQYIELKVGQIGDASFSNSTAGMDPTVETTYITNTFTSGSYIVDPYINTNHTTNAYGYYFNVSNAAGNYSIYNNSMPDIWSTAGNTVVITTSPTFKSSGYTIKQWIHNWPQNSTP